MLSVDSVTTSPQRVVGNVPLHLLALLINLGIQSEQRLAHPVPLRSGRENLLPILLKWRLQSLGNHGICSAETRYPPCGAEIIASYIFFN